MAIMYLRFGRSRSFILHDFAVSISISPKWEGLDSLGGAGSRIRTHAARTSGLSLRTVSISRGIQSLGERERDGDRDALPLSLSLQGDSGGLTAGSGRL